MREKDLGIWQTWTWAQVAEEVRALACGLAAQGFRRGKHLAIIGDNRPRLYWAMAAAQCLGGVPVPLYQDAPAAEMVYVLNDAEIALRGRRGPGAGRQAAGGRSRRCPTLEAHLLTTIRAACATTPGRATSLDAAAGNRPRVRPRATRSSSTREIAKGAARRRRGHALHLGHDRQAQGRVPDALRRSSPRRSGGCEFDRLDRRRECCPTCRWPGSATTSSPTRSALVAGFTINCPESGDTVMTDLREIGPDLLLRAAARVREPADAGDDPHGGRRRDQALAVPPLHGRWRGAAAPRSWTASRCALADRLRYALGNLLVYGAAAQRARA